MSHVPNSVHAGDDMPAEVCLLKLPERGSLRVIFLGPIRGTLVHFLRRQSYQCDGPDNCKPGLHRENLQWCGFAPVEAWVSGPVEHWKPGVLQVTFRLSLYITNDNPRGEVWDISKRPYRGKTSELWGEHVKNVDPRELRTDIRIEPVVKRLLKTPDIIWDRPAPYEAPQVAPCRVVKRVAELPAVDQAVAEPPRQFDPNIPRTFAAALIKAGKMLPPNE